MHPIPNVMTSLTPLELSYSSNTPAAFSEVHKRSVRVWRRGCVTDRAYFSPPCIESVFFLPAFLAEAFVYNPPPRADGWLWATLDQGAGLLDSALNNLSLAMVYSCDVMRGVETLEGLIRKDPRRYMLDVVIFNLCTLYDLSFDAVASAKKKRTLQAVAQRFRLEDIDASSFRMS